MHIFDKIKDIPWEDVENNESLMKEYKEWQERSNEFLCAPHPNFKIEIDNNGISHGRILFPETYPKWRDTLGHLFLEREVNEHKTYIDSHENKE